MGFSMDDLYWMSLGEFLIFSAITAEAYEGREDDGAATRPKKTSKQ